MSLIDRIDDKQILRFSTTILNSLIILTVEKRNHRCYTHDKLFYKLITYNAIYTHKCQRITGQKDLEKIEEIKISCDKVSKNVVLCLDDREIGKEDRAPLREAPRAHRVSTEAAVVPKTEADQKETMEAGVLPRLRRSFSAPSCLSLASATITAARSLLPSILHLRHWYPTLSLGECPRHFRSRT